MMALQNDMIGICMTIANPLVAPTNSVSQMLGTNPDILKEGGSMLTLG